MKLFRVSFDTCDYQEQINIVVADSAEEAREIVQQENPSYFDFSDVENRRRAIEVEEISLEEKGSVETYYF